MAEVMVQGMGAGTVPLTAPAMARLATTHRTKSVTALQKLRFTAWQFRTTDGRLNLLAVLCL